MTIQVTRIMATRAEPMRMYDFRRNIKNVVNQSRLLCQFYPGVKDSLEDTSLYLYRMSLAEDVELRKLWRSGGKSVFLQHKNEA